MKKKIELLAIVLALSASMSSCGKNKKTSVEDSKTEDLLSSVEVSDSSSDKHESSSSSSEIQDIGEVQNYFPVSKMNKEKKLLVLEGYGESNYGRHKFITVSCLAGLMNRDEVRYYINYSIEKDGVSSSQYWLDKIKQEYDLTSEVISFEDFINDYKSSSSDPGYILYSDDVDTDIGLDETRSITAATNMCSIRGWIPVAKSMEEEVIALGLTKKLDVCDKDEIWVFDNYKDEFDNSIIIQQRPMETANLPMVPLRDYAVQNKYFVFYENGIGATNVRFRTKVHTWAKKDMPILGWGPGDEAGHVSFASQFGQFLIPSDFSMNLSVFNADLFQAEKLTQKNEFVPITPESGKHYVAFARSDGDNISVWQNEFPLSKTDFGSTTKGDFPMGWSIQPSLIDIAPAIMNINYKDAASTDYFVAPVSGHGYMYPSTYPQECYPNWFASLDNYLERTDLSVVEILDIGQGDIIPENVVNQYGKLKNLKGGINLNGNRYAGGRGAVVWSDTGKPFISPRETLWSEQKEMVSARINSYTKDYTKIEGYTIVNLHPWSHTYQDVEWVVSNLDDDVVVVSPEQLIDLVSKNVPKANKTTLEPSGEEVIIPIDVYNNKFLANTEDFKGQCEYYQNTLKISGRATKSYKLLNEDNQVIEFVYRALSKSSTMSITLKIGSVEKYLVKDLSVSSENGLSSMMLPLDAYFSPEEYKGKDAVLTIICQDVVNPILIDNVITSSRVGEDPTSNGDKLVDTFENGLEDYVFNSYEKGAFARFDNGMIMLDGSDGWTGFFNNDVNNAAMKYFTMPNDEKISFNLQISTTDTGTSVSVKLIIDGEIIDLTNGFRFISKFEILDIRKVLENVGNKNAVLLIEQRDSRRNNGIGEICYIRKMSVTPFGIDPTDNRFDIDLEDWKVKTGNASSVDGLAKIDSNSSISKQLYFDNIVGRWNYALNFEVVGDTFDYDVSLYDDNNLLKTYNIKSLEDSKIILSEIKEGILGKDITIVVKNNNNSTLAIDRFHLEKEWDIDIYNNQFETDVEDWFLINKSGWENNGFMRDPNWERLQITYALNGSATLGKTYTLPNDENIQLVVDFEALDAANHMTFVMVVDGEEKVIYDAATQTGRNTITIKLPEVEALNNVDYAGKEVTIKLTVSQAEGTAGDAYMWSFKTESYTPAPVINYDPLDNQFSADVEDWVLVSKTGWDNNGFVKDPNWERLQITYALNGSATLGKTYTLPNDENIQLVVDFEALDAANHMTFVMVVDGEEKVIYDAATQTGRNIITIKLPEVEALNNVDYAGKEVTIKLTVSQAEGTAGDAYMWSFKTESYTPVPVIDNALLHNSFETDLEDWVVLSTTGWDNNGATKDPNWPRIQLTYALNGSVTIGKTYTLPNSASVQMVLDFEGLDSTSDVTLSVKIGDVEYEIYKADMLNGRNTITIKLPEVEALKDVDYAGKEITLKLTVAQGDDGTAGDCFFWDFLTENY